MLWALGSLSHRNFSVPPQATLLGTGSSFTDMEQLCSTAGSASIAAFTPLPISVATRQKGSEPPPVPLSITSRGQHNKPQICSSAGVWREHWAKSREGMAVSQIYLCIPTHRVLRRLLKGIKRSQQTLGRVALLLPEHQCGC